MTTYNLRYQILLYRTVDKIHALSQDRQVEKPYTVHYLFASPLKVPSSSGGFPLLFNWTGGGGSLKVLYQ